MRLFIGLWVTFPSALAAWWEEARRLAPEARWVPPEAAHVTLQFLGEVPSERVATVSEALTAVRHPAVPFRVRGIGFFPHARRPDVVWAGVEVNPAMGSLAAAVAEALRPVGFTPEARQFRPHVTLARTRRRGDLAAISANETFWGGQPGDAFYLVESQTGSRYTRMRAYRLG